MSEVKMIPKTNIEADAMKKEVEGCMFFVRLNRTTIAKVSPRT